MSGGRLLEWRGPGTVPIYSVGEAAHHLRWPVAAVRTWAVGGRYPPAIAVADPSRRLLSFGNLVELHILGAVRLWHDAGMRAVGEAIVLLRDRFASEYPLLDRRMLDDGKAFFVEQYGRLAGVSRDDRAAMEEVLDGHLARIDRDADGMPARLFPVIRRDFRESPRVVSIDPGIRFGDPCLVGSNIPTAIVAGRYAAGDPLSTLADDYGRTMPEIEEAIRYEGRIAP